MEAVVQFLLEVLTNAVPGIGELAALTLVGFELCGREGWITVLAGKGVKHTRATLNPRARKALSDDLNVRRRGVDRHLFFGPRRHGLTSSGIWRAVREYRQQTRLDILCRDLPTPIALAC